jgi:hypothetical protein
MDIKVEGYSKMSNQEGHDIYNDLLKVKCPFTKGIEFKLVSKIIDRCLDKKDFDILKEKKLLKSKSKYHRNFFSFKRAYARLANKKVNELNLQYAFASHLIADFKHNKRLFVFKDYKNYELKEIWKIIVSLDFRVVEYSYKMLIFFGILKEDLIIKKNPKPIPKEGYSIANKKRNVKNLEMIYRAKLIGVRRDLPIRRI